MTSSFELERKLLEHGSDDEKDARQVVELGRQIQRLHEKKLLWQKLVASFKHNENMVENPVQLLVPVLVILLQFSSTPTV